MTPNTLRKVSVVFLKETTKGKVFEPLVYRNVSPKNFYFFFSNLVSSRVQKTEDGPGRRTRRRKGFNYTIYNNVIVTESFRVRKVLTLEVPL